MGEKIIGILGGMGPEATIDFFSKIVKGTKVKKDQDHLRILIDNNPKIPDRTSALQGKGPSPLPQLTQSAKVLENAGADFIVIPCVTAHNYHEALQKRLKIPILHIVEETLKTINVRLKGVRRIGLIATTGTIESGLFQKFFRPVDIELLLPKARAQREWVMKAIYGTKGIKAIGPSESSQGLIHKVAQELIRHGSEAIIAGCTEVPLVLRDGDLSVPVIDVLSVLARAAVEKSQSRKRRS